MKKRSVSNSFHSKSVKEIVKKLDSHFGGLKDSGARSRLKKYGKNKLPEKKAINPALIFLKQFNSVMVYILIAAIAISFWISHYVDAYVILAIVIINSIIGFTYEYRAEKTVRALKKMLVNYAKVYRDGSLVKIKAENLVPGDIILLESGDRIPADARIIESKGLQAIESSLTGESLPVLKENVILSKKTALADCRNMVWMGTFISTGQAKAIVVATGDKTEFGKIASNIQKVVDIRTHFQEKTDLLAKQMGVIAITSALVIFLIGYFIRGFSLYEMFLFSVAALVSGLPEGLPAVLAIVLAVGSYRMAKRNAIVRTLPATETLGVVNVIVTDKTGTLTRNTLNVENIILPGQKAISVSGEGWDPKGDFHQGKEKINPSQNEALKKFLNISALSNNSKLIKKLKGGNYEIIGDPTEAALNVLAEKANLGIDRLKEKRIDDLAFSPELKFRASLISLSKGKNEVYVVGAPETIIRACKFVNKKGKVRNLSETERDRILENIGKMASKSMRVIALAYKEVDENVSSVDEDMIDNLVFAGMVGMRDPPRKGVANAVLKAKNAGIRVIMATGDHKETALSIAKEIGIIESKNDGKYPEVMDGEELMALSKSKFADAVRNVSVFARLTPETKLKIAEVLQKDKLLVAMTGDGVNDAPALKKANVGISMGIIGSDVAREASDVVLADDNFVSIVNAIEEGRIVFTNTKQSSYFLITTNFAEGATIITTLILGMPLPLLPIQVLWLNIVTDGVPNVALAVEPSHHDVLNEKPRDAREGILTKEIIPFILLMAGIMVILSLFVFNFYVSSGIELARTGVFVIMSMTQLFNFLNMRSLKRSLFDIGILGNKFGIFALGSSFLLMLAVIYIPFLQNVFGFANLALMDLGVLVLLSSLVFIAGEIYKRFRK